MISVTKLIDLLNKPALVQWANNLGLQGTNLKQYRKTVQKDGNDNHLKIQNFLKKGIPFDGSEKLQKSLEGFEFLGCEIDISNGAINGRLDLAFQKDGKRYVVDLKRNENIYLATKLQLSAYKYLYDAHEIAFMNTETMELKVLKIDTEKYFNIIKKLYIIHTTLNELNETL